jgi:hypothetical protein
MYQLGEGIYRLSTNQARVMLYRLCKIIDAGTDKGKWLTFTLFTGKSNGKYFIIYPTHTM